MPNPNVTLGATEGPYTSVEFFGSTEDGSTQTNTSYPKTIQELTGGLYSELIYNSLAPVAGPFMGTVAEVLSKCDLKAGLSNNEYHLQTQQAVMEFQSKMAMQPTGILNNATWQTMLAYASKYSDIISNYNTTADEVGEEYVASPSPHYSPFFDSDNIKNHRRSEKDIKIVFGNNSVVKTLKNVYMRSVSVEVDTSGNPISEVYEFIAQDIKESDEPTDAKKYTTPESSVDLKPYLFDRVLKQAGI